jgi:hypothetical protein
MNFKFLFLQHLPFLADFGNQHDHVTPALKVSFPSAATGQTCQGKSH